MSIDSEFMNGIIFTFDDRIQKVLGSKYFDIYFHFMESLLCERPNLELKFYTAPSNGIMNGLGIHNVLQIMFLMLKVYRFD